MAQNKLPFSQRHGEAPQKRIQYKNLDKGLRNRLYNGVYKYYLKPFQNGSYCESELQEGFAIIWSELFKEPADEQPEDFDEVCDAIKSYMQDESYDTVYDLIEFLPAHFKIDETYACTHVPFMNYCNDVLQSEAAAYKFVDGLIIELTSPVEIEQVESALHSPLKAVNTHLKRAQELLADKKKPDYRNSVKESISAVESLCKTITGTDQTLGQTLGLLTKHGIELPISLQGAFEKLYGWSSSADGIRHGLLEKSRLDSEDAIFALVACSAFINYLIVKADKVKIDLKGKRPRNSGGN